MGSSQERCPLSYRVLGGSSGWAEQGCSAMAQLSCVGGVLVLPADPAWEHWMGSSVWPPLGVSAGLFLSSSHQRAAGVALLQCWWAGRVGYGDEDEDRDANGEGEEDRDRDGEEVSQRTRSSPWDNQCSQPRGDCLTPETSQPGWTWGSSPAL